MMKRFGNKIRTRAAAPGSAGASLSGFLPSHSGDEIKHSGNVTEHKCFSGTVESFAPKELCNAIKHPSFMAKHSCSVSKDQWFTIKDSCFAIKHLSDVQASFLSQIQNP